MERVLLSQWRNSPRLRVLITEVIAALRDDLVAALDDLETMLHLDTAEGVWLDRIGAVLGLARPAVSDPAQDPRWGFDAAGEGFDQVPFRGVAASDALFPLADVHYRQLLRARAILVHGDGTPSTYTRAVHEIDPGAAVVDQRNMQVSVTTDRQWLLALADEVGALPRSAGVGILWKDRGRFGYDSAGEPFDRGAFA